PRGAGNCATSRPGPAPAPSTTSLGVGQAARRLGSITVAEGLHLLIDPAEPVRYGNHSCEPNLWHADAFTLVARRDIAVGEELTSDYATHTGVDGWAMDCRCGSRRCRGRVTGRDWRLPALRAAYGRHWIPPLLDRIDASGGTG
ncbi:SET domain-containing protein-lysine N-methyltransferase, partial [Streptomyces sp. NPDC127098]|uniref:SET domain-containing protein-lysine N-methyltransferase n=1 Tax=Streptomyces sp. NPDC127098 TaxID=3347137 RepID=UPI00366A32A7